MERQKITAKKRTVVGRKVKQLRKEEILPANVFGKKTKSVSIQVSLKDFTKVFSEAGETGLVDLTVEGEKEVRPVLIQNVQKHPVDESFLHADFRQIILTEKIKATIPVEFIGQSPADTQKLGILVKLMTEIEVEALAMDLPEHFEVDVSKLEKVDDVIFVKDLKIDRTKIELKTDEKQIVAKIEPLAKEEVVAPSPTAEAPAEGAPVAEGAAPVEGEGKAAKPEAVAQPPKPEPKTEEKK